MTIRPQQLLRPSERMVRPSQRFAEIAKQNRHSIETVSKTVGTHGKTFATFADIVKHERHSRETFAETDGTLDQTLVTRRDAFATGEPIVKTF